MTWGCVMARKNHPFGETKQRIGRFVEDAAPGSDAAVLRKLVRSSIEYVQEVKHRDMGSHRHRR